MYLELDGQGEKVGQLLRALRGAIESGRLRPGARLPSSRLLSKQLGMARNTVLLAYEALGSARLTMARPGSGTYVIGAAANQPRMEPASETPSQSRFAERLRAVLPEPQAHPSARVRYDMQCAAPVLDLGFFASWGRALHHAAERTGQGYPSPQGQLALRRAVAARLAQGRGIVCGEQDILIVNGAQQALSMLAQVLLDEGDGVAIEDPTFPVINTLLRAHGAQVLPTPVDDEGMVVDAIESGQAKMVIVNPACQFPLGMPLSWQRRQALLRLASDRGVWVVEHDQDSELLSGAQHSAALKASDTHGRVVFVGSLSRLLSPALRLGYMVAPPGLLPDLLRARYLQDYGSSSVDQLALAHYLRSGRLDRHLRRVTTELRRRRAALREGLAQHCSEWLVLSDAQPALHCMGWLPRCGAHHWPALRAAALERGLGLYAVNPCAQAGLPSLGLMLGFASLSVNEIARATAILGEVLSAWPPLQVPALKRA